MNRGGGRGGGRRVITAYKLTIIEDTCHNERHPLFVYIHANDGTTGTIYSSHLNDDYYGQNHNTVH